MCSMRFIRFHEMFNAVNPNSCFSTCVFIADNPNAKRVVDTQVQVFNAQFPEVKRYKENFLKRHYMSLFAIFEPKAP